MYSVKLKSNALSKHHFQDDRAIIPPVLSSITFPFRVQSVGQKSNTHAYFMIRPSFLPHAHLPSQLAQAHVVTYVRTDICITCLQLLADIDRFTGTVMHTQAYREHQSTSRFENSRVVVVGFGNSGLDLAVELSRVSKKVAQRPQFKQRQSF